MNSLELRRLAHAKLDEAGELGKTADAASEETQAKITALMAESDRLNGAATNAEEIERRKMATAPAPAELVSIGAPRFEQDPARGFKSELDFVLSVLNAGRGRKVVDERLKSLTAGADEAGAYDDASGGYLIPVTFIPRLLQIPWEGDPTAGLTTNIPMATPRVNIPARVDSDHSTSVSGGFTVARRAETQTATATRAVFKLIGLNVDTLMGVTYATEEILNDSAISLAAIINAGFRDAFASKILDEKLSGIGVGCYLGILNSPAKITVTAESGQGASTIVYKNVVNMMARCWRYGSAIWMANQTCLPQLCNMIDASGRIIWQSSATADAPQMLLGRPIVYTDACSALGTEGDLILVNWSEYLEGTYQPIQGASSVHVRFLEHEQTFKFWTRNAGAPWWLTALTPKHGDTRSPIVTLNSTRT